LKHRSRMLTAAAGMFLIHTLAVKVSAGT